LWQYRASLELTRALRPDIFKKYLSEYGQGGARANELGKEEQKILTELSGQT
jgi:hypothetical protein